VVAFALAAFGCRSVRNDTTELDSLLRTVSYEVAEPSQLPSAQIMTQEQTVGLAAKQSISSRVRAFGGSVASGLSNLAGAMLKGVFVLVKSAFDSDDDDRSTRGRADRSMNQWIEERDRWREED
ncbi:MAG: hypothetical protein AAGA03_05205, partial [Planctomycetota bacterium]